MLKKPLITVTVPLLSVLAISAGTYKAGPIQQTSNAPTGTLQKMIVKSGSVTMNVDLNGLNGSGSLVARPITLQFAAAANSFFPILVFDDLLRGSQPGLMTLILAEVNAPGYSLPAALDASLKQLVVEKLPSGQGFDLAVRDSTTGFTFFNIQGHQYDYDAAAQSLAITNARLLISKELANSIGRPSDAGSAVGTISIGAVMQPTEITQVVNGETKSMVMPPLEHALGPEAPTLVPGPDVIVGEI